jgi:hypothetical protein
VRSVYYPLTGGGGGGGSLRRLHLKLSDRFCISSMGHGGVRCPRTRELKERVKSGRSPVPPPTAFGPQPRAGTRGRRQPVTRITVTHGRPHGKGGGGVLRTHHFFLRTCPAQAAARPIRAYELTHMCSGITRRLCGWLGAQPSGTQDLRALKLWHSCRQWRAQP